MKTLKINTLNEIPVARVKSENGTAGAATAFKTLESKMKTLNSRKMYGVYYHTQNLYYACVKTEENLTDDPDLERSVIPGGLYAKLIMTDWHKRIPEIGKTFNAMADEILNLNYTVDVNRPSVEYYFRFNELHLLLPVREI